MAETVLPSRKSVALHESFHAASLIVDGWIPQLVRIDLWEDEERLGTTKPDWNSRDVDDPEALRQLLMSVALGPISEGEPELDSWPIEPGRWINHGDGEMAKFICERLDLGAYDWGLALHKSDKRRRDPDFRSLVWVISQELARVGLLLKPELEAIAEGVNSCP